MNILLPSLIFILVVLAGGCSGSTEPMGSGSDLMPLAVGNRWIYVADTLFPGYERDTIEIIGDTGFGWGSEHWFHGHYAVRAGNVLYTNRANGLWISPSGSPDFIYHYGLHPARKGDEFNHDTLIGSSLNGHDFDTIAMATVVRALKRVQVPAGTFNCYVYADRFTSLSMRKTAYSDERWIAPGVGIIRYTTLGPDLHADSNGVLQGTPVHYSLLSYTLK